MIQMYNTKTKISEKRWFEGAMIAAIIANAVMLGMQTYVTGGDTWFALANNAFLLIYVVEAAIRLHDAGSLCRWSKDRWNVFDAVVIAVALVPAAREAAMIVRLIRLVRVVKVMRYLPELRIALSAMTRSLPGVASLGVGTFMVIFLYGMIGVELFSQQNPDDFGNIGDAMLTMFMLVTLENLPDIMHTGMDITLWAVPYFVTYALLMGFILFNLFINVVFDAAEKARDAANEDEADMDIDEALSSAQEALDTLMAVVKARQERTR